MLLAHPQELPPGMRVDGLIFTNERMLAAVRKDQAPDQVANVAFLPGIQHASLAMPDIHWGYGFCIGGVCATDPDEGGVISPGGVGYDINCLTPEARVLHGLGYTRPIGEMAAEWRAAELCLFRPGDAGKAGNHRGLPAGSAKPPQAPVLRMVTEAGGDEVSRHEPTTRSGRRDGMVPLGRSGTWRSRGCSPLSRACL